MGRPELRCRTVAACRRIFCRYGLGAQLMAWRKHLRKFASLLKRALRRCCGPWALCRWALFTIQPWKPSASDSLCHTLSLDASRVPVVSRPRVEEDRGLACAVPVAVMLSGALVGLTSQDRRPIAGAAVRGRCGRGRQDRGSTAVGPGSCRPGRIWLPRGRRRSR